MEAIYLVMHPVTRILLHFIIDPIPSYQYLICTCKQFDALTRYGNRRIVYQAFHT